jgi:acyl carrier protein
MTLEEEVIEVIAEQAGLNIADVRKQKTLEELGVDDLNRVEIVFVLEDDYQIVISDEEQEAWVTVLDVINCVKAKLPSAAA